MIVETEPLVTVDSVTFRLSDAEAEGGPSLAGTRLLPALSLPDTGLDFDYADGFWHLTLARPPAGRMEYRFQVRHPAGELEEICDPGNPLRAPGAFGDKSVVEFPGYTAPGWLTAERVDGDHLDLAIPSPQLGHDVAARIWGPVDAETTEPLPLLVAHDGPEYDRLADLTGFAAALIRAGRLPRHRVALLTPGDRDDEYSANPVYARALHDAVLPALRDTVAVGGPGRRDGGEPGRAGHAARATRQPGPVRRPVPAVGVVPGRDAGSAGGRGSAASPGSAPTSR